MRLILFIVTGLLMTAGLSAQTLIGRITDTKGQAIPNATFYIHETTQGIMANEDGEFQVFIKKGDYTCEISSLGYEKKKMTISIPEEGLSTTIVLFEKAYSLREVTVTPGKEDPAYRIMRHVIANAPYHLHQVKSYESDIYLKGNFKVEKLPALIKSQIKEKEVKDMIGKMFVYESQNEVKYSAPDKYEQHVVAVSSSIPKSFNFSDNVPLSMVTNNIYRPSAFSGLLAPGSFSVYKFQLEDSYNEGETLIHKIRVIPRKKSGSLVSGWIYIVNETWNVQQANLSLSQAGVTSNYNLAYHEVKPGAFLPTAYDMNMKINTMGIKAGGQFYTSIKYNQLETNNNDLLAKAGTEDMLLGAMAEATASSQKEPSKKQQRVLKKLDELASKDKLTTREAYKMAELVQKTIESDDVKEQKRQLQIRPIDSLITVTRDSLALKQDSSFWKKARTIPLHAEELISYMQSDSIRNVADSLKSVDSLQNRTLSKWVSGIIFGEKVNLSNNYYIQHGGLLSSCGVYNFIDGFLIGQRIEVGRYFDKDKNRSLSITPAAYYTTARKEIDFAVDGALNYAPMRGGKLFVSTGNTLADYAGNNGTGRFGNTLASILFAGNTAKYYQKKYATISNKIDIANGLALTTGFNYENRNDLDNNTSYNFFNNTPNSNRPHGQTEFMPAHKAYVADITIEYTPLHRYSVWKGKKYYARPNYPTMRLSYKKGFSGGDEKNSSFDNIEATIQQNIKLGVFNSLHYEVNAGAFLSSEKTYLADYKHFRTNEMFLTGKSFNTSFYMKNYLYATNDKWLQGHVTYASNYLLLKQIPFMQSMLLNEAVHINSLLTPDINYNEAGYSIGFGDMIRVGVFVGFNKLKYESTGVLVTIPLLNSMNK